MLYVLRIFPMHTLFVSRYTLSVYASRVPFIYHSSQEEFSRSFLEANNILLHCLISLHCRRNQFQMYTFLGSVDSRTQQQDPRWCIIQAHPSQLNRGSCKYLSLLTTMLQHNVWQVLALFCLSFLLTVYNIISASYIQPMKSVLQA